MLIQALPNEIIKGNSVTFRDQLSYSYSVGANPSLQGTFSQNEYISLPLPSGSYAVKIGGMGYSNGAKGMASENAVVTYLWVQGHLSYLFTRVP